MGTTTSTVPPWLGLVFVVWILVSTLMVILLYYRVLSDLIQRKGRGWEAAWTLFFPPLWLIYVIMLLLSKPDSDVVRKIVEERKRRKAGKAQQETMNLEVTDEELAIATSLGPWWRLMFGFVVVIVAWIGGTLLLVSALLPYLDRAR